MTYPAFAGTRLGGGLLVASTSTLLAILAHQAWSLPARAALFPQVLLLLCAITLVLSVAAHLAEGKTKAGAPSTPQLGKPGFAAAVVLIAGVLAIPVLGFYLSTTILHFVLYLICIRGGASGRLFHESLGALAFAFVMGAVNWAVFGFLLELSVPAGLFF